MNPRDLTREQFGEYLTKIRNCLPFADERSGLKESQDAIDEAARRLRGPDYEARYKAMRDSLYRHGNIDIGEALLKFKIYGACPSTDEFDAAIDALRTANEQKEKGNG